MIRHHSRPPPKQVAHRPNVAVLHAHQQIEVWLCRRTAREYRIGTVHVDLAADAQRHGQDLVGELVQKAFRELEQSRTRATIIHRKMAPR
jgi:hypothetical protein